MTAERLIDVAVVAKALGWSPRRVLKAIAREEIEATRASARAKWRVPARELVRLKAQHGFADLDQAREAMAVLAALDRDDCALAIASLLAEVLEHRDRPKSALRRTG